MDIVVEFERRMEVCSDEAASLQKREQSLADSPWRADSSTIAFVVISLRNPWAQQRPSPRAWRQAGQARHGARWLVGVGKARPPRDARCLA